MIMVTPEIPVAVGSRRIAEVGDEEEDIGTFEITLSEPLTENLTVSWWIIN